MITNAYEWIFFLTKILITTCLHLGTLIDVLLKKVQKGVQGKLGKFASPHYPLWFYNHSRSSDYVEG